MKLSFLVLASSLAFATAASRSSSSSTSTSVFASATASPAAIFNVANFSASAQYMSDMYYQADIVWNPNPNYSARCLKHTSNYTQCPNAAGVSTFNSTECLGPGSTLPDGRWYWQVKPAQSGFNFEFTLGPVQDAKGVNHMYYGCKYFAQSSVKCNNTVHDAKNGPPAAYLDAPSSFTIPVQTTSACQYDVISTSTGVATKTTGMV